MSPAGAEQRAGSAGASPHEPRLVRGTVLTSIDRPTSLAFGPDGRLYVASPTAITALTLDPATKHVLASEPIASGLDWVLGIAFDPTAPASPVTVYASHQDESATGGFQGTVSTFTAPGWQRQDVITGLPTSAPELNHLTNGLAFDSGGTLYIAQGSATDSGIADPPGSQAYWPETPLSAAVLRANIHAPGFNGAITYTPAGPPQNDNVDLAGGDVAVFASGLRNPYDLVLHSNGRIYATDNGPLGQSYSATCSTSGSPSSTTDELNLIELDHYYGHPNRNRGRTDARQCTYHPGSEGSGAGFTGPIASLPAHCSCDGIVEYTGAALVNLIPGDLIYTEFSRGNISRARLSNGGASVQTTDLVAEDFRGPLDVTMGPDGTIYVAEYNGDRISYLAPDSDGDACADPRELGPNETLGGRRSPDNPWDFFDVNGNSVINLLDDIYAVVAAFGPASGPNYAIEKDRSPPTPGAEPWTLGPPDGTINAVDDIMGIVAQFGHSCAG